MSTNDDIALLELLASKICHDLISPIGAINNGVEFLEDMGADAGPEVTGLIAFSAAQASAKLQAYRMAYGAGGADANIKPADVHKAIAQMIEGDKKIKQDWDPQKIPFGPEGFKKGLCKILVCTLKLAMECLPKGGTLTAAPGKNGSVTVTAIGDNAGLKPQSAEALALATPMERMEPKYVHAYMTGLFAKRYGFTVKPSEHPGTVTFEISG